MDSMWDAPTPETWACGLKGHKKDFSRHSETVQATAFVLMHEHPKSRTVTPRVDECPKKDGFITAYLAWRQTRGHLPTVNKYEDEKN